MSRSQGFSRRHALRLGAAASALPLVHIRTAGAAGKVKIAFWDHWVPDGNKIMQQQVDAWAKQNNVDVTADFITSNGNKLLLTEAAEAQAHEGHDAIHMSQWDVHNYADQLEPVDDVVNALTAKYGDASKMCHYLANVKGHWAAVPSSVGNQTKGPCARISVFKQTMGLDLTEMYPTHPGYTPGMDAWTWEQHLKAAQAAQKANMTFGIGLGQTSDSVDTAGALFSAYGAELVDEEGTIKVKSPEVQQVLEYAQELVKALPKDAVSYDDASNNRALISGQSALIWNPPSAWAVAKRDAPKVAEDCWSFSAPQGPKGRFVPVDQSFFGIWRFAKNKSAVKDLISYLMQVEQVEARCNVVIGYDLPPFAKMVDFKIWEEVEPPKGTVYNYPIRPWHQGVPNVTGAPAPPDVAVQMYQRGTHPTMFAKLQSGQTIPQVIAWAQNELEGFMR